MKALRRLPDRPVQEPPGPVVAAETLATWLPLGWLGLAMTIGFTSWYLLVTHKEAGPSPNAATTMPEPTPAPLFVPQSAPLPQPLQAPARSPLPALTSPSRPEAPAEAVARFYRALSAGDGQAAVAIVIPSKRGVGPFNEANISKFYRSFKEPLSVRSIRQIDANLVEAKYRYTASRTPCEGTAIVETEVVLQQTVIRRIRANC